MQGSQTIQSIKVSTTGKGAYHWEDYLLGKQKTRLNILLNQMDIDPWSKRKIHAIFSKRVTKENIIPLSSHPIRVFLSALLRDQLDQLTKCSTTVS